MLYFYFMKIEVYADKATKDLTRLYKELSKAEIDKSITRAINSTLLKVRTKANREIRQIYNLGAFQINSKLNITKSTYSNHTGFLKAYNYTFPLKDFNPKQIQGNVITKRIGGKKGNFASSIVKRPSYEGVMVEIMKGQSKVIKSAFLLFKGNQSGSVKAKGTYSSGFSFNSKESIKTLSTVSIASALKNSTVNSNLKSYTTNEYSIILKRELEKRIKSIA